MPYDITEPVNELKTMGNHRTYLDSLLKEAIRIFHLLNDKDKTLAQKTVAKIILFRRQIYEKAASLGYVQRCIDAIPVCKGECCRWHFPKNLNCTDLFIALCNISSKELIALQREIVCHDGKDQCPVLGKNGCLLSYYSRPTVCAISYPCFAGESFHTYIDKKRMEINRLSLILKALFQKEKKVSGGHVHENQV